MPDAVRQYVLERRDFQRLLDLLIQRGYEVLGPTLRDGAIVYDVVKSLSDFPVGWTDEQQAGHYRVRRRNDEALFGYTVGPQSWKKYLHPAEVRLLTAERTGQTFRILNNEPAPSRRALLGVRACELAAITLQDRILQGDRYRDPIYAARRQGVFIVAVNCTQAAPTCFCTSMGTGPRVRGGYDLVLTELVGPGKHEFVIEAGSDAGAEVLADLAPEPSVATETVRQEAAAAVEHATSQIQRRLDTTGIRDLLYEGFDHPRWDNVAQRCLTCANCTMVCPTCFCTTVEDVSDVTGTHAERWRKWDSCFTQNFSYIHGGSIRSSVKSRYRQWMTHKLAFWIDQFGASGCVGCGRCITWCPVGIDITEEVRAIRESPASSKKGNHGKP
ncbi:MAG: 4Fe-4S dicluster domain-containing protein [Acidobacteriia bacterium]|nr:4Fe-4S dicluster domain-containing protein [Terriglobia bacterium]